MEFSAAFQSTNLRENNVPLFSFLPTHLRQSHSIYWKTYPSRQSRDRIKDDEAHVSLDYVCLERFQALKKGRRVVDGVHGHLGGRGG